MWSHIHDIWVSERDEYIVFNSVISRSVFLNVISGVITPSPYYFNVRELFVAWSDSWMNGQDTDVNKLVAQFVTLICLSLVKSTLYIY